MRTCIYCNKALPGSQFSLEHIIPTALGGKNCKNIFKTRSACAFCNNTLGIYADGEFIKSWFISNAATMSAFDYLDKDTGGFIPFAYFGRLAITEDSEFEYEIWSGPCGERVFTRHTNDKKYSTFAGGNPQRRKGIQRDAVLYLTNPKPFWTKNAANSFIQQFSKYRCYAGNFSIANNNPLRKLFPLNDSSICEFKSLIVNYFKHKHQSTVGAAFTVDIGFADRFCMKVALGIGANVFGSAYISSPHAHILRKALWTQSTSERRATGIPGTDFWNKDSRFDDALFWPGGHTIILFPIHNYLALSIYIYGKHIGTTTITDEILSFGNSDILNLQTGSVYVIIPSRGFCTSRIDLEQFVAHKHGSCQHNELAYIESLRTDIRDLPSRT